jgi:prepilin-type N-terminal cleavage/methylation domain-containing protein
LWDKKRRIKMRALHRHHAKGFTLVEIMIVVAIIALIAAVAIPNMLRARHNAGETSAIASMRTLVGALESFRANQTPLTYPANLVALSNAVPPYIDAVLSSGTKQGYTFTFTPTLPNTYTIAAAPVTAGVTGTRGFFVDQTGVIRVAATPPASAASPALD